ncbi:hypothetical protein L9W80_18205 [Vibrio aestuarianus]|uniref:hypothetical protein n=1 Tax=Vibrio aestuarianus TaxID=28171 RepID=UPI00237CEAAA|nr:hypothetical protein [Vibrio aestuarianus]MDE1352074.1 hypothetical protein [Vibrio aestuarianus]
MKDILSVNAHLKFVEFLLYSFDNSSDSMTLGELRSEFKEKFDVLQPLLNQNFGIYRLLPLILMKQEYKNSNEILEGNIKSIKIIRDSIAHNQFVMDETGYTFRNDKETLYFSYDEFNDFLHRVENEFYTKQKITIQSV